MASPSVKLIVVPRERFSHAVRSLESIYRNTDYPFDLVYVDGRSPDTIRIHLERESRRRQFQLIRFSEYLSPNRARNIGLQYVAANTQYVVFLDNDVEVEPGWLKELVACAEDTGAWAVSPVYCEGQPRDETIHMAGGNAEIEERSGARALREDHLHYLTDYRHVRPVLKREITGFFEFHCVLLRLAPLKALAPLDEELLSTHEHLDLSLLIRDAGGSIYLAPDSRVTYVHGLLDADDLEYASVRWSDDWNRRSTRRFATKWRLQDDPNWLNEEANWGNRHLEHLKRLRRTPWTMMKRHASTNVLTRRAYAKLRAALS